MFEWLLSLYRAVGADHPIASLVGVSLAGALVLGGAWLLIGKEYRARFPQTGAASQVFHEAVPDDVSFSVGGLTIVMKRAVVESNSAIEPSEPVPVRLRIENGVLYCDVTIPGPTGPLIKVVRNAFTVTPQRWDRNYSDRAFEVVDERNKPVFQLIQKSPWHWIVYGVIPDRGKYLIASDHGTLISNTPTVPPNMALKPIFKYPSWKHLGQYAP